MLSILTGAIITIVENNSAMQMNILPNGIFGLNNSIITLFYKQFFNKLMRGKVRMDFCDSTQARGAFKNFKKLEVIVSGSCCVFVKQKKINHKHQAKKTWKTCTSRSPGV